MKGKCSWQELQQDKHNCSNQNKAWSYWHMILTFLSDTCINPCFCSVCSVQGPTSWTATKSGPHMQHASEIYMPTLHF